MLVFLVPPSEPLVAIPNDCFYGERIFSVAQEELVEVLSIVLVDFSPPRSLMIAQLVEHHIFQR